MFNINFNLMTPDNKYISVNHFGGSKPPPYAVELNFRIYTRLLSNLKKFYATVGTGLAPVRKKLHIKSNSRTTARVVPMVA